MSDPTRSTPETRPQPAAQRKSVLGTGSRDDLGGLRIRAARREKPEVSRLVEWVLNITQARYDAHRAGEPDPYDLALPEELAGDNASERRTMEALSPDARASNDRSTP